MHFGYTKYGMLYSNEHEQTINTSNNTQEPNFDKEKNSLKTYPGPIFWNLCYLKERLMKM